MLRQAWRSSYSARPGAWPLLPLPRLPWLCLEPATDMPGAPASRVGDERDAQARRVQVGHGRLKKSTRENSLGTPPKRALAGRRMPSQLCALASDASDWRRTEPTVRRSGARRPGSLLAWYECELRLRLRSQGVVQHGRRTLAAIGVQTVACRKRVGTTSESGRWPSGCRPWWMSRSKTERWALESEAFGGRANRSPASRESRMAYAFLTERAGDVERDARGGADLDAVRLEENTERFSDHRGSFTRERSEIRRRGSVCCSQRASRMFVS